MRANLIERMKQSGILWILSALSLILVACGGSDHDHDHDHDHHHEEGHHHDPPHGGAMAELGDHFAHLELTLNPDTGKLTVYLLDDEAVGGMRITNPEIEIEVSHREGEGEPFEPFIVKALAIGNPLTGEQPGDTSEFEGQDERVKSLKKFHVKILTEFELKGQKITGVEFGFPEGND